MGIAVFANKGIAAGRGDRTSRKNSQLTRASKAGRAAGMARPLIIASTLNKAAEPILSLSVGHFLGHVQNQLAIFLVGLAQQTAKLVEEPRLFAAAAPGDVVR